MKKIYSGIYINGPNKKTDQFIMDKDMIEMDNKLTPFYLMETITHNLMLAKTGIVPKKIARKILKSLLGLVSTSQKRSIIDPSMGDVHENVEYLLKKDIGDDAGWFHIARSRNDQATTDQKLFTKKHLITLFEELNKLEYILLSKVGEYKKTIMPGFTHMRPAMPSSFGFWWQSYLIQIAQLHAILKNEYETFDISPLGAGASYGVNWKIDPIFTAQKLGFSEPLTNGLAAIDNRGIEDAMIIGNLSVIFIVLSRMMEDLIIWSLPELNYVCISEEYTTGSSIMPQKMNPDIAEKIRSKSSKLVGNLNHVLMALKGTSSGYNRDSAESKIAIVDSLELSIQTLSIASDMLKNVVPNQNLMKMGVIATLPTKLADSLVKTYGLSFRTAHTIVGKTVSLVEGNVSLIKKVTVEKAIEEITGKNVTVSQDFIDTVFNIKNALEQYQYKGSAGPRYIEEVNKDLKKKIVSIEKWTQKEKKKIEWTSKSLYKEVYEFIEK